jgi:hypothetical protein
LENNGELMKKILFITFCYILLFFITPIVNAQNCIEYKQSDRLYIQIINQTSSIPLASMKCNITFYDNSYTLVFGNVSTTELPNGLYYWIINSSLTSGNYIATAYCSNNVVSSYSFCLVGGYSNSTIQNSLSDLNSNMASNFTALPKNCGSGSSNLTSCGSGNSNLTSSDFDWISNDMSGNFTNTNNLINDVNSSLTDYIGTRSDNIETLLSDLKTDINSWISSNFTATNALFSNIAEDVWNYETRTLTDYGTLLNDVLSPINDWIIGNQTTVNITNISYAINISSFNISNVTVTNVDMYNYTLNTSNPTFDIFNYTVNATAPTYDVFNYTFNGTTYNLFNYTINATTNTYNLFNHTVNVSTNTYDVSNYTVNVTTNTYNVLNQTAITNVTTMNNVTTNVNISSINLILPAQT